MTWKFSKFKSIFKKWDKSEWSHLTLKGLNASNFETFWGYLTLLHLLTNNYNALKNISVELIDIFRGFARGVCRHEPKLYQGNQTNIFTHITSLIPKRPLTCVVVERRERFNYLSCISYIVHKLSFILAINQPV